MRSPVPSGPWGRVSGTSVRATEEYIRQSIFAPNAIIADGYPANVMPQDLAEYMTAAEFERLVQWLRDHKGPTLR
jgi:hypothetical protein